MKLNSTIARFAILAISALFLSCTPKTGEAATAEPKEVGQTVSSENVSFNQAPANKPWYAEKLESLGFSVFPVPSDLPELSFASISGAPASSRDEIGKVVLLNIWATWCPPCRAEMPSMQALYEKTRDVPFTIMGISTGERKETVQKFIKENRYTYPMYLDETGSIGAQLASRGIPTTYLLDKQGKAIAGIIGSRMYDGQEMVGLIRELAEKLP